jgi:hypothetical protein
MDEGDTWSPDEPQGTETFEQSDEASDEENRLDPEFAEAVQLDPSVDPANEVDELELAEAGVELDDPGMMATLLGGGDDPDGIDEAPLEAGAAQRSESHPEDVPPGE